MAATSTNVTFRPIRVGLLVRIGEVEDIVQAAGLNSLLWGGRFNPLIPFSPSDTDRADRIADSYNVDFLYPIMPTGDITDYLEKRPFLNEGGFHYHKLLYSDFPQEKKRLGYLSVLEAINHQWSNEFKDKADDYQSNWSLIKWEVSDPLSNLFAVTFGYYPCNLNLRDDYESLFVSGLRPRIDNVATNETVSSTFANRRTPLALTSLMLVSKPLPSTTRELGLYIGDPRDFRSLVNFWNLRAAGNRIQFLPKNDLDRYGDFLAAYLGLLDKLTSGNPNVTDRLNFYFQDEKVDYIRALAAKFKTTKPITFVDLGALDNFELVDNPSVFSFRYDRTLSVVDRNPVGYKVLVNLPEMKFLGEREFEFPAPKLVATIHPDRGSEHPDFTLRLPYIRSLNEDFGRDVLSMSGFEDLRVEQDGVGVIVETTDRTLEMYPIAFYTVIQKVLKSAGIDSSLSQAGLLTKRILEKIEGLFGASIFKVTGVRKLIRQTGVTEAITRGEATKQIRDDGSIEKFKSPFSKSKAPDSNRIFDTLLTRDFFRAGLNLECNHCRLINWLPLKDIDDFWTCQYCGDRQLTSVQLKTRGDWRFRRSGLFGKDNNQEGAIPVILTLSWLDQFGSFSEMLHCPALNLTAPDLKCEIDFCGLKFDRLLDNVAQLVFGECKDEGGLINDEDIANLEDVWKKLKVKGIMSFIVFSKTASQFIDSEIELFRKLNSRDVPMILLTTRELEILNPRLSLGDDGAPHKHPMTLEELAENCAFRYLCIK